jgi:hypothetical protein
MSGSANAFLGMPRGAGMGHAVAAEAHEHAARAHRQAAREYDRGNHAAAQALAMQATMQAQTAAALSRNARECTSDVPELMCG